MLLTCVSVSASYPPINFLVEHMCKNINICQICAIFSSILCNFGFNSELNHPPTNPPTHPPSSKSDNFTLIYVCRKICWNCVYSSCVNILTASPVSIRVVMFSYNIFIFNHDSLFKNIYVVFAKFIFVKNQFSLHTTKNPILF